MSVVPVAGLGYWYDETGKAFRVPGRPPLPLTVNRDAYVPLNTLTPAADVGPYSVADWVERFPTSGNSITLTPGTYSGVRYWGTVKASAPGVTLDQCWVCGPDPDSFSDILGCVQNYGSNPPQMVLKNTRIDPSPWVTVQGRAHLNPYYLGIHGGNVTARRCEFVYIQDPWNWIGPSSATAAATQAHLLEMSWIHKGLYFNDVYPPNDGQPHADGFQTNYGWNLTIRGNVIGGVRDVEGYNIWPTDKDANPLGGNTGDDFWNSALMLKQEAGMDPTIHVIRDVLIEDNILGGGTATINHAYDSTRPNTWGQNVIVRRNRLLDRGADWGVKMKGDGPGLPGYPYGTGSGYYILKAAELASVYSENTNYSTGAPVPVTRG